VLSGETLEAGAVLGKVTASGKYKALDPAVVDGSEAAAGILYGGVDASAADAEGIAIVRLAEVHAGELVWPDGITAGEQTTALGELAALSIIARLTCGHPLSGRADQGEAHLSLTLRGISHLQGSINPTSRPVGNLAAVISRRRWRLRASSQPKRP
jgi:hypothetical protein